MSVYRVRKPEPERINAVEVLFKPVSKQLPKLQQSRLSEENIANYKKMVKRFAVEDLPPVKHEETTTFDVSKWVLKELDIKVLETIALQPFTTSNTIIFLLGHLRNKVNERLAKLQKLGLIQRWNLFDLRLWTATRDGLDWLGLYEIPVYDEDKLPTIPTIESVQFRNYYSAIYRWGLGNPLYISDWEGEEEEILSYREMETSFARRIGKQYGDETPDLKLLAPELRNDLVEELKRWRKYGSDELEAYNYILYPRSTDLKKHTPDIVLKRPRKKSGRPSNIAIVFVPEKAHEKRLTRVMEAYAEDKLIYERVYFVARSMGTARKIEELLNKTGLYQSMRGECVPAMTHLGFWKNTGKARGLWQEL